SVVDRSKSLQLVAAGIVAGGCRWRSVLDAGRPPGPIGKLAISLAVFAVSSVPPRGWGAGVTWPTTPNLAMSLPIAPTGMPPHETVPLLRALATPRLPTGKGLRQFSTGVPSGHHCKGGWRATMQRPLPSLTRGFCCPRCDVVSGPRHGPDRR